MISVSQLDSWTSAGAQTAAKNTYAAVEAALAAWPALQSRDYKVFLQGSYANSTNIRGDSDVDVVAMIRETFNSDTSALSSTQLNEYRADTTSATYTSADFRKDVTDALASYFGWGRIEPKSKCIRVEKRDGYVDADVVPAAQHRLYTGHAGVLGLNYIEGIAIYPRGGSRIINYPKQHIQNGSAKNQQTHEKFKPTVRLFKNMENAAVQRGLLREGVGPGYFVECLMYNCPDATFEGGAIDRDIAVLRSLIGADLAAFMAVDGIHTLFGTDPGGWETSAVSQLVDAWLNVLDDG